MLRLGPLVNPNKKSQTMTRQQAITKLIETRTISTDLLKPLSISFESFLKFAQIKNKAIAEHTLDRLIDYFERGTVK